MKEIEIITAPESRLNACADFLGLRQMGKRGIYWVRKSSRHAVTKKDFTLNYSTGSSDLRTAILRAQPVVQKFLANT